MDAQANSSNVESSHAEQQVEPLEQTGPGPHRRTQEKLQIQEPMSSLISEDQHVDTTSNSMHVDATVEHLEDAPQPPEETAKIPTRDSAASTSLSPTAGQSGGNSLFFQLFGQEVPTTSELRAVALSKNVEGTLASENMKDINPESQNPDHSVSQTQGGNDGSSSVPSVLDTERATAFSPSGTVPISLSEAGKSLLSTSDTSDVIALQQGLSQGLPDDSNPTFPSDSSHEKGKARESPTSESAIRTPAPIQKAASRPAVPFFGESDAEMEQEARAWLPSNLNTSATMQTPSTSDTRHRTSTARNKPLQRKMSYSASGSGTANAALNVSVVNPSARASGAPMSARLTAPDTREAPPRSAFALTAAALTNASTPGGINGFLGPHTLRDGESDLDVHDADRWGAVPNHMQHHERELDRRSRELDRRERELERRERELERRMREFDSERARWSLEVKTAPAWSEAVATLAAQMDARFNEERKKAEEREMKWARLIQQGLLARVQEAIEKERHLYGVPERMSDQEANELLESSVGWLMQSDEDIADRVRFQSLLHLAQERLAMEARLQPAPGSSSLSLAWRLALGPSVITEVRYNKAMELLQARANPPQVADGTSKYEHDSQGDEAGSSSPPSNSNETESPLDPLTLDVMANKAAMEYVVAFTSHIRKEGPEMLGEHAFALGRILREDYMESVRRQAEKGAVDKASLEVLVDFICPMTS